MRFVTSPQNEAGETDLAILDPSDPKRQTLVIECAHCGNGLTRYISRAFALGHVATMEVTCPACQGVTTIEAVTQ